MEYNPIIYKNCPHPFYWKVRFSGGIIISQYTDDGTEILYKEVLDKVDNGGVVESVEWYPTYKGLPVFVQEIDFTWQRPIVFRRNRIKMDGSPLATVFAIGWQATIANKNYKSVMYIDLSSDRIVVSQD